MFVKSKGIVLRQFPYNDNSIILKIFSENNGVVSAIIKRSTTGKSKNKKSGLLQALTLLDVEYEIKPNENFIHLKEIKLNTLNHYVPDFEIYKNNIKLFLGEVLSACLRDHHGEIALFDFTFDAITYLNTSTSNPKNFHLGFLIHLCRHFGICPEETYSPHTPYFNIETGHLQTTQAVFYPVTTTTSQTLFTLFEEEDFKKVDNLIIDKNTRKDLLRLLIKYLDHYLHTLGNIRSLSVLEDVFE